MSSCCTPDRFGNEPIAVATATVGSGGSADLIDLPGGSFVMGDDGPLAYAEDGESPTREVSVAAFAIDPYAVSNERYAEFVDATGYVTDAERIGCSFVFAGLLPDDFEDTRAVAAAPWWREVFGADWRHPAGPQSSINEVLNHPVVHVSARDAGAFAAWSGTRLPTEPEWEYAARAGTSSTFPWGEELEPAGVHRANVWQGEFPVTNTEADGWYSTCPVNEFEPNDWKMFNMIGNVWEWTTTPADPTGTILILKGGSYLCHSSYCHRYRPGARSRGEIDGGMGNAGFRVVRSA